MEKRPKSSKIVICLLWSVLGGLQVRCLDHLLHVQGLALHPSTSIAKNAESTSYPLVRQHGLPGRKKHNVDVFPCGNGTCSAVQLVSFIHGECIYFWFHRGL